MVKKLIIFDLDGTLADTSEGIRECHRYTNLVMRSSEPTDQELEGVIGAPLLETYMKRFGYSESDARRAVGIYRERYAQIGLKGVMLYEGIREALAGIKATGRKIALATLKAECFAREILFLTGISDFFDVIHGMDEKEVRSKADLVRLCMEDLQMRQQETVLVGDSHYDAKGAAEAQISFIAVTYGFGYKSREEAKKDAPNFSIAKPYEILNILEQF